MAIIIESSGGKFERAPEGVHFAVCVGIWDLGTQPSELYKPTRKVMFYWELIGETAADGSPFYVSQTFTMSLHEKSTLRPKIEAWRGKPLSEAEARRFDLAAGLLGRACQLQVTHKEGGNGKTYANITSIMAMPKGAGQIQATTPLSQYSITDGENYPAEMPDYVKNKIRESHEFKSKAGAEAVKNDVAEAYEKHATKAAPAAQPAGSALPWESGSPAY